MRYARVFWLDTDGGEEGDGAWYWRAQNANGNDLDEDPVGPFETAIDAGRDCRTWIIEGGPVHHEIES